MSRSAVIHQVAELRDVMSASPLVVTGVLGALLVCAVAAVLGSRLAAAALVPLAGAWLLSNQFVEGATVLPITWNHGVTVADLVSLVALLIAAWRLLPPIAGFVLAPPR